MTSQSHENCPICLEYITDDTIKITSCHHNFHNECLTQWIRTNNSCPLRRTQFNGPVNNDESTPLTIPLSFWFNRNPNLAIPLMSIPFALFPENYIPSGSINFSRLNLNL